MIPLLLILMLVALPAHATPVEITSGVVRVSGSNIHGGFVLAGQDFSLSTGFFDAGVFLCDLCRIGQHASMSSTADLVVGLSDFLNFSLTWQGQTYTDPRSAFTLLTLYTVSTLEIPETGNPMAPFQLGGTVTFRGGETLSLTGGGVATLFLEPERGLPERERDGAEYDIMATPEPTTLGLVATALGLGTLGWRRRHR